MNWGFAAGLMALGGASLAAALPQAGAEEAIVAELFDGWGHLVVPQSRGFVVDRRERPLVVERVEAQVEIRERTARTTLDIFLHNPGAQRAEAVLLLPVPNGAAVNSFLFDGSAAEPTARLLPAAEARRTYDEIVARIKDPALLEFAGYQLIRTSVFPVEAGGRQRLQLSYDELLQVDGDRVDYVLPRSESLTGRVPWRVQVSIMEGRPVSMTYSPSHAIDVLEQTAKRTLVRTRPSSALDPGAFRLSYLIEGSGVSASLVAYPDPTVGGGYFLLMAGLPARLSDADRRILRDVTIVLDRSGSMAGEKLDQAKKAALQVIEGLAEDETFNIVDYSSQVASFAPSTVPATGKNRVQARAYLESLRPTGGTNIHDALLEVLRQPVRAGYLPITLFLTDGLPTVGRTSEIEIREMVAAANQAGRRIFTFGVGEDVNVPLLDRISDTTRATSTYVLPGEDVELKVAKVYQELYGPVLADLELEVVNEDGTQDTRLVRELLPERLPDLFEGDHLVLLGQYREERPLRFKLTGNFLGEQRTFAFRFDLDRASTKNAFVPRLWAARRIAFLADQIRQAGAAITANPLAANGAGIFQDPRYLELSEEILRLSTRFGILSEYTSFLATEGTDLGSWGGLISACNVELNDLAVLNRFGESAVQQGRNFNDRKQQVKLDYGNAFWVDNETKTSFSSVQQICDRAFFKQGERWIDSNLIEAQIALEPTATYAFGSEEHTQLLEQLVREGRQGLLSLEGEILIRVGDENVLIRNDAN